MPGAGRLQCRKCLQSYVHSRTYFPRSSGCALKMMSFVFVSCISVVMQESSRCPVFSFLVLHTIAGLVKVFASGTMFGDLIYLGRISITCCLWKQDAAGIRLGQAAFGSVESLIHCCGVDFFSVDLLLFLQEQCWVVWRVEVVCPVVSFRGQQVSISASSSGSLCHSHSGLVSPQAPWFQ